MTTEDFIEILEQRELVPANVTSQLRKKAAQGDNRITPKAILKYLVKKELVTRRQAKQLLETTLTVTPLAESSILGMVPMPKTPAESKKPKKEEPPPLPSADPEPPAAPAGSFALAPEEPAQEDLSSLAAESFGAAESADSFSEDGGEEKARRAKKRKSAREKKNKNEWDSPLLIFGGGGLLLLVIVGITVTILINREDAEAILSEASDYFEDGSYTQAINQYDSFVEKFPNHPQFSAAKVKLGMAKLWKDTQGKSDFVKAFGTAKEVLGDIEDEPEFKTVQQELASLLETIAKGIAGQAEKASEPGRIDELIELTNKALALCTNTKYSLKKYRDEVVLDEVRETLERVKRARLQSEQLATALGKIDAALKNKDMAQAFAIHKGLLEENPGLLNNEELAAKVLEISQSEATAVVFQPDRFDPLKEERPDNTLAAISLAERSGNPSSGTSGVAAVRVDGSVFGLKASDGAVLWRRFLGIAPKLSPQTLPNGKLLIVDNRYGDLLFVEEDTGELIWRLELKESLIQPVITKEHIYAADQSGKLHVIELSSGIHTGYLQLPQKLRVPPYIHEKTGRLYLVGDHSSLYTISTEDHTCLGVFFLGHESGSITAPPAMALGRLVVAENIGSSTAQIKVLRTNNDGVVDAQVTSRKLKGLVTTPMLSEGRRIVVVTGKGFIGVYEAGPGEGDEAFTEIATRKAEKSASIARQGLLDKGYVWIAGKQLTKFAVLPTGNRLPVQNTDRDYLGDTFDHPLLKVDDLVVHVRRPRDKAGVIVAAMDLSGGRAKWETRLAEPLAGAPVVDANSIEVTAVTTSGAGYLLGRQALQRRVEDSSEQLRTSARRSLPALDQSISLGQGRLAAFQVGSNAMVHYRPKASRKALDLIELPSPLSSRPIAWGNRIVTPTEIGQVYLFDSESGKQVGSPFQPALTPNEKYRWLTPTVYRPQEQAQLIISDGEKRIYRLDFVAEPQPHLRAEVEADVGPAALNTRLSALGEAVCAGTKDGRIAIYQLPGLEAVQPIDLGAQVTWGPFSCGDSWILATDTEEMVAISEAGEVLWRQAMEHGPCGGEPLFEDGELFVLWQQGGVSRITLEDGSEAGYIELEQPVVAGPTSLEQRLIVATSDGTLLVLERP